MAISRPVFKPSFTKRPTEGTTTTQQEQQKPASTTTAATVKVTTTATTTTATTASPEEAAALTTKVPAAVTASAAGGVPFTQPGTTTAKTPVPATTTAATSAAASTANVNNNQQQQPQQQHMYGSAPQVSFFMCLTLVCLVFFLTTLLDLRFLFLFLYFLLEFIAYISRNGVFSLSLAFVSSTIVFVAILACLSLVEIILNDSVYSQIVGVPRMPCVIPLFQSN